jgi:Cft2 family RNA processing exonuclease
MIDYEIISSGSKGNCVVLGDVAVDMGVPYRAVLPHAPALRLVLLTHIHRDHFNRSTVRRLASERPTLRWGCGEWLAAPLVDAGVAPEKIDVYTMDAPVTYGGELTVSPFPLQHNVPNCGYRLWLPSGNRVIYATDTCSLHGVEAPSYDLYLVEGDYGENEIVERIRRKQEAGEYVYEYDAIQNHLSREQAENWLYSQMGPKSVYVLMHVHEE